MCAGPIGLQVQVQKRAAINRGGGRTGGENFPLGKIFQEFLGGRKIFPPLFLVNFDVFLVDFDAKTQTGGENMPKIQNGGRKKEGGTDP